MTTGYWQAKIWGLLHDPALKALHNNQSGRGENSFWQQLPLMEEWVENNWNPEESGKEILKHIKLSDYISSSSDRGAIGSVTSAINYNDNGLDIFHLLSGERLNLKLNTDHQQLLQQRRQYLHDKEQALFNEIPAELKQFNPDNELKNLKRLFWWLWRCLPQKTCDIFQDQSLILMPAETRLPDSSIWSHASITSALAGALAGYNLTPDHIREKWSNKNTLSHPYLVSFTFSPVQELIKASRKMRDFWAGSWILHYLSAKVCWELARKYGPDCFLYPNLFAQPLIDHWLRQYMGEWVKQPSDRSLLTAGFPNVIILILPHAKVADAMQQAKSELLKEWRRIAHLVFEELQVERHWMKALKETDKTWQGWLNSQWQTYWTAIPIGATELPLKSNSLTQKAEASKTWIKQQNSAYKTNLFFEKESDFIFTSATKRWEQQSRHFSVNVGSWWAAIFDQTRSALTAVKNARNWELPTAFGPRSTISGLGSSVHPDNYKHKRDWVTEGDISPLWQRQAGLFDGIEQLNATEVVKRGLDKILPQLLASKKAKEPLSKLSISYPDLTSGVAGYLHQGTEADQNNYYQACQAIQKQLSATITEKWGIPWADNYEDSRLVNCHPRLLNIGWLTEDLDEDLNEDSQQALQQIINSFYPQNNPTSWYVLAAGDGDSMNAWLKGEKMQKYAQYIPQSLNISSDLQDTYQQFIQETPKRMGPSTHNALSRALLDFSNQLVPYLTEERYAGRLIYSGGDDVLAYTNLWEWDKWLWDIRQCFRGDKDPQDEFTEEGNYWRSPKFSRPLFTMGKYATISFGIVIAHHSVPLAIALESLWEAEEKAKDHLTPDQQQKDAVQVKVLYGNGNTLKSTAKFDTFDQWQNLVNLDLDPSLFEAAASLWEQHPIPIYAAIEPWIKAFCDRREIPESSKRQYQDTLAKFIQHLWMTTPSDQLETEVKNWLKLAAFMKRNRKISLK
ncbi:MAG: type III-B CRISPR-associated protein Cas10/Cmr2 [Microcystaceae cyanobacterium]